MIDPTGLYGIPSGLPTLGDLWHGLTDQIGCGFQQLAGYVGDGLEAMAGFAWEHRIGLLQTVSTGLLFSSIFLLPGFVPALAAYESWSGGLYVASIGFDVLGALAAPPNQRGERLTAIAMQNAIGLGIGGLYKASPLTPAVLTRMVGAIWDVTGALSS